MNCYYGGSAEHHDLVMALVDHLVSRLAALDHARSICSRCLVSDWEPWLQALRPPRLAAHVTLVGHERPLSDSHCSANQNSLLAQEMQCLEMGHLCQEQS